MRSVRRSKLSIEQLERRDCPSFVFRLTNGGLFVTGSPTNNASKAVLFTQTANNQFSVSDGGVTILSHVTAYNISLSMTQHRLTPRHFQSRWRYVRRELDGELGYRR